MRKFFCLIGLVSGFRGRTLLGVNEDAHGLADPETYRQVFDSPSVYSTPSNLLERKERRHIHHPSSFAQVKNLDQFLTPFASLNEAKSADIKLQSAQEQMQDKAAMLRSRIDVFRSDLESQVAAAKKDKRLAEDRLAKRGLSSSFVQTAIKTDFQARELERISEMQRSWKLAADRLAHSELPAAAEPNAALIDANSRVEADKKRMTRLNTLIDEDLDRVSRDASLVAADEDRLKKEQALRDLK
jgi:hypothetical protein